MKRAAALLCASLLAACAIRPPSPDAFSFGVMGDTPYTDGEEVAFLRMIERMNAEPLAFVVHVGDFKGSGACSDELFARRKAQFDGSRHPLVFTPGDNEWADCRARRNHSMDPLERLAKLREVFFADDLSMGASRMPMTVQRGCVEPGPAGCACAALPENRSWTRSRVRFVTLNVTGSNNNVGFDRASDEDARCRNEANRRWLRQAVDESEADGARALVVMIQANPFFGRKPAYRDFIGEMQSAAQRLARPMLLVHGDTHVYRADAPFTDIAGRPIFSLTRLETYGSPFVGWVKVTVDPDHPQVFSFQPHLSAFLP